MALNVKCAIFALVMESTLVSTPLHTEYWWEPRWTEADCLVEKRALDQEMREHPEGFTFRDPHFKEKYRRYFRRLTECGL